MYRSKKLCLLLCICLALVFLTGCSALTPLAERIENKELRANTESMLHALMEEDLDAGYALMDGTYTKEEFSAAFEEMTDLLVSVEDYELLLVSAHRNTSRTPEGTVTVSTAGYQLTSSAGIYVIETQSVSTQKGLHSFLITPYEQTSHYSVGTLSNMSKVSVFQWVLLLSNIIILGFILIVFIDCCRQKLKLKALWLLLIALGVAATGITFSATSFHLNFNILSLLSYNCFITYGDGTKVFRLIWPYGTVIYCILRNSLIRKAQTVKTYPPIPPYMYHSEQPGNTDTQPPK